MFAVEDEWKSNEIALIKQLNLYHVDEDTEANKQDNILLKLKKRQPENQTVLIFYVALAGQALLFLSRKSNQNAINYALSAQPRTVSILCETTPSIASLAGVIYCLVSKCLGFSL